MGGLTWLHLSDWHQKGKDFDRHVVRQALIKDIKNRKVISQDLEKIDFIVFSGDVAFSGKPEEYKAAKKELFEPLLEACNLSPEKLFIVPGNHDLDRAQFELLPAPLLKSLDSDIEVKNWLFDGKKRSEALKPFKAFKSFVSQYTKQKTSDYANIRELEIDGKKIVLFGINSSWMCGRRENSKDEIDDKGVVVIGEPQILDLLEYISGFDIKIAVLHHPFDWLADFESSQIKSRLINGCDFILRGHQHEPHVAEIRSTYGDCVVIPAGACYDRRVHANAYNFVHLDFESGKGVVFLRCWNGRDKWREDIDSCAGGNFEFISPTIAAGPLLSSIDSQENLLEEISDAHLTAKLDVDTSDGVHIGESPIPGLTLRCILRGHRQVINGIAWSPDGRFLASSSNDETIRVWDIKCNNCLAMLKGHYGHIYCVSWSPDSRFMASGGLDGTIIVWDAKTWKPYSILHTRPFEARHFRELRYQVWTLAWSPDGSKLASGSSSGNLIIWETENWLEVDNIVAGDTWIYDLSWLSDSERLVVAFVNSNLLKIWNTKTKHLILVLEFPSKHIHGIAKSSRDKTIAIANGNTIRILDPNSYTTTNNLEGHTSFVRSISFSSDGSMLATKSMDNTVRLWASSTWQEIIKLNEEDPSALGARIAFHPSMPVLATFGDKNSVIRIWDLDIDTLLGSQPATEFVRYTSAKIVLVGESNIGKSCLAMRLAEDRYPKEQEQGTTHGMRFWPMQPEQLNSKAAAIGGERRDIILWDLGGQNEYRLVHQLFLHDTALALILFDPTRGDAAFDEVRAWNLRLEKQLQGRKAVKLLVGSKMDASSTLISRKSIDRLVSDCSFAGYYETSAFAGRGIPELRHAIADALDWEDLAKTSRPELFQHIRDEIEARRKAGDVVLYLHDLDRRISEQLSQSYEPEAVKAVAEQLAAQGVIAMTRLNSGDMVLILQIGEIERYAGSIIVSARENPRGVPALEERSLVLQDLSLPGIRVQNRLRRDQERVVLESIVELLIQNGICFRSQGLLVFPTLFPDIEVDTSEKLAQSVSLFYDFTGAIDNIYASLVAWLVIGGKFGSPRLWASRVEFDEPSQGICGIRQIKYRSGLSHLDLYFAEETTQGRRDFFIRFIEDHLRRNGVEVREHQAIKCGGCGFEISEDIVHKNIALGQKDVICPICRKTTLISEGVDAIRGRDPDSDQRIIALRTEIEKRAMQEVEAAKQVMAACSMAPDQTEEPIRILHLSDLHFTGNTSPQSRLQWLIDDITKGDCLGFDTIEYLVVSGDVTDRGNEEGFEKAREFIQLLTERFELSAQRCIFVPGNHDVQDLNEAYNWSPKVDGLKPGQYVKQGEIYLIRNDEKYKLRLRKFSDAFFHKVVQQPYPLEYAYQGIAYLFPDTRIQFITLNSCWQIDQFNRKRSGVHTDAVAHVIRDANLQLQEAIASNRLNKNASVLRIGLWHHAIAGQELMANIDFIGHLQSNGAKICLHGDIHEPRRELICYWDPERMMHVIGAGSFGSPPEGRPESTACLYNILEVQRDLTSIRVHTRCQPKSEGIWEGLYIWPSADGQPGRLPYYDILLK